MSTQTNRTATRRTLTNRTASSTTSPVASTPDGSRIPQRTVCLVTELRRVGNRKKVSSAQVEVDADKEAISVSKTLLDAPQLLEVINSDTGIRRMINANCLPSFFRAGVFLVPLVSIEGVEARLLDMQAERARLVENFLDAYPRLVDQAHPLARNFRFDRLRPR